MVTCATVGGTYFFTTGDSLVSKKYFEGHALDAYQMASKFGRAIPQTVLPLLIVDFHLAVRQQGNGCQSRSADSAQSIRGGVWRAGRPS